MVSKSMLYRTVASLVVLGALSSSALAARTLANNNNTLVNQYRELTPRTLNMNLALDVSGNSVYNGAPMIVYPDHNGNNQRWQVLQPRPGVYVLRNANSLHILRQQGNRLVQDTYNPGRSDSAYYEWTITNTGVLFTLRNNGSGQYLGLANRTDTTPTMLNGNGPNRLWYFSSASGSAENTHRTCL